MVVGLRADLKIRKVYDRQIYALFDVLVTDTDASSYRNKAKAFIKRLAGVLAGKWDQT